MGQTVRSADSKAFRRHPDAAGNQFTDRVLTFLRNNRGARFTNEQILEFVGHEGITAESAKTYLSMRWVYAGFNDKTDPWLNVQRTKLPSKHFAYEWVTTKRKPERNESPAAFRRRTQALKREKDQQLALEAIERSRTATNGQNGSHVEPDPILDSPVSVEAIETLVDETEAAIREYRAATSTGFESGDVLEVVGHTTKGQVLVRSAAGELFTLLEVIL
jgi:hypothetical protein